MSLMGPIPISFRNKKIMTVIDKIAPYKNKQVKGNTQKWFGRKVLEKLNARDKLFKKLKNFRLIIDKELYKKDKYDTSKVITSKKQSFIEETLSEKIGKHQELWESLKFLGMPNKTVIFNFNPIKNSNTLSNDTS